MRIRLPPAKWHRVVTQIADWSTTGWDWSRGNSSPGFVGGRGSGVGGTEADADVGDLIVSFEVGSQNVNNSTKRMTYLWIALEDSRVPLLQAMASVNPGPLWASEIGVVAQPLLRMPHASRVVMGINRRIAEMTKNGRLVGEDQAALDRLYLVQSQWLARLAEDESAEADYVKHSFDLFLRHTAQFCDLNIPEILRGLCIEHGVATDTRPTAITPAKPVRNLVLRRRGS